MFQVKNVAPGSVAERYGIRTGEHIVSIDSQPLIDYIDYVYFSAQKKLKIVVDSGLVQRVVRIKKHEDEDLGLEFIEPMLSKKRVCANKCVFCFVDQLPRGMRGSLYLKDEDWRYSVVMGNYVTMSSISQSELQRIIRRRVSPLNISVHTVDEVLRRHILGNANAVPIRPLLKKLAKKKIRFHAQAVICPGLNDAEKLTETIAFLKKLYPAAMTLAVVPVGLTVHRDGLTEIAPVTKEMAVKTVAEVEKWQKECLNSIGSRFVFAADEYYIKAGLPLPSYDAYETFGQIENGVGLMRKFIWEAEDALEECKRKGRHVSVATGVDAAPFLKQLADNAEKTCGAKVDVYAVQNDLFGSSVTVAGLLGGRDYMRELKGKNLGDTLLISANSLRYDDIFLDGVTLCELSKGLDVDVVPVNDGAHFIALLQK